MRPLWQRVLAASLAWLVGFGPMTPSAFAAVTKLADEPLNVKNSAEPNIVLTLDDSTSMLSDFLPELVIDQYCRDGNGILQAACGVRPALATDDYPAYIYHQNNVPYNAYDDGTGRSPLPPFNPPSGGSPPSRAQQWPAPAHNAAFNRLYYNPRLTYEPPAYADGTSWPTMNSANTTAWTLVPADPFKNPAAPLAATPKVNLTSSVNVGFWCNTDWTTATLRNDPMYCRTNGSGASSVAIAGPAYAASLMGPRPGAAYNGDANDGDYVLPWPKPGAAANNDKYFSRNGTMSLWCDKTHPKWPQTNGAICITPGAPVAQTCIAAPTQSCNLQANPNNCSWTPKQYLPAGCDPLCVGAECGLCIEQKTAPCPAAFRCSIATGTVCPAAAPAPASPACDRPKRCSTTAAYNAGGAVCNVNADCPPIPTCSAYNQIPAASANCNTNWNGAPVKTLQADADSNGEVCRHNNGGTGYAAGKWDYSAAHATYKTQVTGSCPATPDNVNVPRHYWKTSVEWCQNRIATATATDPWRGAGGSACKAFRDTSTGHIWPRYYRFGKDPGTDNVTQPAFQRVDLHPGILQYYHEWKDEAGDVVFVSRTYAQEMENYANWFAYYRTRIQAVKTATSLVFKELDNKFRIGFHTLANNPTSDFANVNYFDAAQKTTWFSKLYGVYIKTGRETPNLNAVVRVGEWYATGGHPELAAATDPIVPTLTCQKNWHMLFTDGITNQPAVPTTVVGNVDQTIPVLPEDLTVQGLVAGQPWPTQFRENAVAVSNSLADYVTHYWARDFKPAMTNNVPASDRDPATWQHGNFAAMSLGTEGKLPTGNQSATEDQIKAGTAQWSQTIPNVYKPDASGVDDLWHAAINGRGRFVNAQSVDELRLGMGQILKDIENQAGARSGVTFDSVNLSASNKFVYRVKFEPGWAGSLTKVEINPTSGAEVLEKWRAADRLAEQLTVLPAPNDQPWFTKRKILTINDSSNAVVPFLWGSISATQKDSLAPGKPTRGAQTVEYLRGDRSREGARLGQMRVRSGPLGDIVNSQAVIVGPPKALAGTVNTPFYDPGLNPGYQAFFDGNAARQKTIFVGANDGMVHAFADPAADDANPLEPLSGYETWAFVPKALYRPDKTGLGGLTLQDGGLPPFTHHYYVDGPMRVADVDFGTAPAVDWRTLLVGGLGKGGKSFYALDVTTPVAPADTEANIIAANKVLWEFTHADMGYSYGKPLMVKTHAHGWVVILTSGYNNPSGDGKVYFVKPETGALLAAGSFPGYLSTGAGTPGTPSGLAQVAGYVINFRHQVVEELYAGDVLGNLWRFNVSNADPQLWTVDRLAVLTDSGGTVQPITTPPQIEIDLATGADRWVFVGTGRMLHDDDLADTQVQSVYAIRDGNVRTPSTAGLPRTRADLLEVTDTAGLASRPAFGWYDDLTDAVGQRITVPVQAELSVVAYVTTQPPGPDKCLTGQPSRIYAREYSRGNSRLVDGGGSFVESIYVAGGLVGLDFVTLESAVPGTYPETSLVPTCGGTGGDCTSPGKLLQFKVKLPDSVSKHRMSWRLLGEI